MPFMCGSTRPSIGVDRDRGVDGVAARLENLQAHLRRERLAGRHHPVRRDHLGPAAVGAPGGPAVAVAERLVRLGVHDGLGPDHRGPQQDGEHRDRQNGPEHRTTGSQRQQHRVPLSIGSTNLVGNRRSRGSAPNRPVGRARLLAERSPADASGTSRPDGCERMLSQFAQRRIACAGRPTRLMAEPAGGYGAAGRERGRSARDGCRVCSPARSLRRGTARTPGGLAGRPAEPEATMGGLGGPE